MTPNVVEAACLDPIGPNDDLVGAGGGCVVRRLATGPGGIGLCSTSGRGVRRVSKLDAGRMRVALGAA